MSAKAQGFLPADSQIVRLCLLPGSDYSALAVLLNHLNDHECHRVCLDLCAVSILGTVEFRVLGNFAELFRGQGGFLKLENCNATVVALVHVFGFSDLMTSARVEPSIQKLPSAVTN